MNKYLLPLVSSAAMALVVASANATVTYNDGDVFVGFRDTTGSAAYVVDLGAMDQFLLGSSLTDTTFANSFTATQLSNDLTSYLGAGWSTNSHVVFGLFGGYQAGSSSSIPNLPDNALLVGEVTKVTEGNLADSTIAGLTGDAAGIGGDASGKANGTVPSSWVSPNGGVSSWASYQYGTTANANNNSGAAAYGYWGHAMETSVTNNLWVNSSYSSDPSVNNGFTGALLGTLSLTPAGNLNYVVSAVPEPSTYALFGISLVAVAFVVRRQQKSKSA